MKSSARQLLRWGPVRSWMRAYNRIFMSWRFLHKYRQNDISHVTSKMSPLVLVVAYLSLDRIHQSVSFQIGVTGNLFTEAKKQFLTAYFLRPGYLGGDSYWKITKGVRAQDSEEIEYFPEDEGFIKLLTEASTKKIIKAKAPVATKTTVKCKYKTH